MAKTILMICTTVRLTIGTTAAVRVKSLNFDAVLEECPFVYQILGCATGE